MDFYIEYFQEPDETFSERLWGLTEMFPESVQTACEVATDFSISSTKALYKFSCNASWIFFTSSMILFAPVLFETERAQMAELELSQKQRVSLDFELLSLLFMVVCPWMNVYITFLLAKKKTTTTIQKQY